MDREQLKQFLLELLQNATRVAHPDITEATAMQTGLGLDSLDLVGLIIEVQDGLDIALSIDEIRPVQTVGDLLTLLQSKLTQDPVRRAA